MLDFRLERCDQTLIVSLCVHVSILFTVFFLYYEKLHAFEYFVNKILFVLNLNFQINIMHKKKKTLRTM